jgi:hypothetical protein
LASNVVQNPGTFVPPANAPPLARLYTNSILDRA